MMRMKILPDTLDDETSENVIDMIAKALLMRADKSATLVTWDELERAANLKCEILKEMDGVRLRRTE